VQEAGALEVGVEEGGDDADLGEAYVRIQVTLLINHCSENKSANCFWNFKSACSFLMITCYCFYVLCIWQVFLITEQF